MLPGTADCLLASAHFFARLARLAPGGVVAWEA